MKLHPMVTFSGNCREALEFYRECFGGELSFEGLPDDMKTELPEGLRDIVLSARLVCTHFTIYASDLGETTARGRISLLVDGGETSETYRLFGKIAQGGTIISDLCEGQMGVVLDRFGVEWLFVCEVGD